jgi:hypothetical protein
VLSGKAKKRPFALLSTCVSSFFIYKNDAQLVSQVIAGLEGLEMRYPKACLKVRTLGTLRLVSEVLDIKYPQACLRVLDTRYSGTCLRGVGH